ncbi:hypothetical protein CE91St42_14440 [Oscillospiraceae bacterium]|nr:hypothetical protein CE91St42_14440 [Oscillospiraceae bacterium]
MTPKCDFSGWATRANLKCSDGRTIRKGAFDGNNGKRVPLMWNHIHNDPEGVLGHAILESREDGVYAYGYFNNNPISQAVKEAVVHGDIVALSIWANELQQQGSDVIHGNIRELSLVMAGANPGAYIDAVISHGEKSDTEAIIYTGENIILSHADDSEDGKKEGSAKEKEDKSSESSAEKPEGDETVLDVYNSMTDKQKQAVHYMIGEALAEGESEDGEDEKPEGSETVKHSEGGDKTMKRNIFEKTEDGIQEVYLSHADQEEIIANAKTKSIGTLRGAMALYAEQHSDTLQHGIDDIEALFPDYRDIRPGAPEVVSRDQGWVTVVMNKVHKSPISRIRTKQMDARQDRIRAKGYKKGTLKTPSGNMKLITRTTDPQTIYITDAMNRDDRIDITDFDVVEYQYGVMRQTLNEEIAVAIMIGDGRDEGDPHKIYQEHIRSIWNDDNLYAIHYPVDVDAAKTELQGSNTGANFGDNYVYAEAVITATLYSREQYKGTGTPDLYCDPHLLNVMLLARDLNGRRIYDSKSDLAKALNVNDIHTAEQFAGLIRTDTDSNQHKLLGIFVNLADYTLGATKGGEITRFNQFDIDFNQEKYMIETRLSGALTRIQSAIVLEEPVGA